MSKAFADGDNGKIIVYVPTGEGVKTIDHLNELVEDYINLRINERMEQIITERVNIQVSQIAEERVYKELQKFNAIVEANYVKKTDVVVNDGFITKSAQRGRGKRSYKLEYHVMWDIYNEYNVRNSFRGVSYSELAKKYGVSDKTIKNYIKIIEEYGDEVPKFYHPGEPINELDFIMLMANQDNGTDNK